MDNKAFFMVIIILLYKNIYRVNKKYSFIMLAIDKNDYVDYDIGASLPSGLTYVEGKGLVVFGQGSPSTLRKHVVINPDALKSTTYEVNLFDEEKGELNPDLYEQMALPDGMTYNKNDGLVLTGSGDNAKSLTINPNYVPKNINLFDVETKKIDTSLSTLPEGLNYSRGTGLEIGGDTLIKSLVIDPNGFTQKTNLFETNQNKINEDLYIQGGDSRLPKWVIFDELTHSITVDGFPQGEEETPVIPKLFINGGSLKENIYLIASDTGFLKAELPAGMTFDPSIGLKLENNSGGSLVIPTGDTKLTKETYLLDYTNFNPANPDQPLQTYYPAINIPTYINNGDEVYLGIYGFYFNDASASSSYITAIGGKELILKKVVSGVTTNLINVTEDGVDPETIASGIDASKITKGTLTNIPIASNKPLEIINDTLTLSNKEGIRYNGTNSTFNIQSNGDIQYDIGNSRELSMNSTKGITYTAGSDAKFQIYANGDIEYLFNNMKSSITIDKDYGLKYIHKDIPEAYFKITPDLYLSYSSPTSETDSHNLSLSPSGGIQYTGEKSVFKVYPSGNVIFYGKENSNARTQIIRNCIECTLDGSSSKNYFRSMQLDTYGRSALCAQNKAYLVSQQKVYTTGEVFNGYSINTVINNPEEA